MPETPTPGVNGHVRSSPALHASMSMLSLAPAARMFGLTGLTARPGSFCLFCENRLSLLPTVTSVDPPGVSGTARTERGSMRVTSAAAVALARRVGRMTPPMVIGGMWPRCAVSQRAGADPASRPFALVAARTGPQWLPIAACHHLVAPRRRAAALD